MNRNARIAATAPGTAGLAPWAVPAMVFRPWSMVTTYAPQVRIAPATNISQPYFCTRRPLSYRTLGAAGRRKPAAVITGPNGADDSNPHRRGQGGRNGVR